MRIVAGVALLATGFTAPRGEHLCNERESVVLSCLLESQGAPPALVSLCLVKASPRTEPVLHARERVDGVVDEPFAKDSGTSMVTVMKMGDTPFSREVELRTKLGIYGVEKTTNPKDPSARAKYERTLTMGRDEGKKKTTARCDDAHSATMTDNIDAMVAFQK